MTLRPVLRPVNKPVWRLSGLVLQLSAPRCTVSCAHGPGVCPMATIFYALAGSVAWRLLHGAYRFVYLCSRITACRCAGAWPALAVRNCCLCLCCCMERIGLYGRDRSLMAACRSCRCLACYRHALLIFCLTVAGKLKHHIHVHRVGSMFVCVLSPPPVLMCIPPPPPT